MIIPPPVDGVSVLKTLTWHSSLIYVAIGDEALLVCH